MAVRRASSHCSTCCSRRWWKDKGEDKGEEEEEEELPCPCGPAAPLAACGEEEEELEATPLLADGEAAPLAAEEELEATPLVADGAGAAPLAAEEEALLAWDAGTFCSGAGHDELLTGHAKARQKKCGSRPEAAIEGTACTRS